MRNVEHSNIAGNRVQHDIPMTLRQQQLEFAAAIRNPQSRTPVAGVDAERMVVYHDLFFNNFKETLSSAFPVLHKVVPATLWQTLCAQFFAGYYCNTPYLARLPQAFLSYLQTHPVTDPPWLMELAQWEWTELDLFLESDAEISSTGDDVLNDVPILSPLVRRHAFAYAVHHIDVDHLPDAPAELLVHLLAWRKADDDIGFMQLNAMSACLCELIECNGHHTGNELLLKVVSEFPEFDPAIILQGGADTLQSFYNHHIVFLKHQHKDKT